MNYIRCLNFFALEITAQMPIGRSFAILAKNYFGALTKLSENLEVERHYSILILLDRSDKSCTQQVLCEQLKIDKVSMVRMVDNLMKKDLVRKVQNQLDRRESFIELTPKAKKIMPELHEAVSTLNKAAFKGIPKEEQKTMLQNLVLMQQNLESLPADKIYINYKKSSKKI